MLRLLKTKISRLRILGFLEGASLVALVLIAVPMKYVYGDPSLTQMLGPVHGALFLLYVLNTFSAAIEQKWNLKTTAMVLAACLIPFGTFYVDYKFLRNIGQS